MSYICESCGKLVEDNDKYGSGRFCCRACANRRNHSPETKQKIKESINKVVICECKYCRKKFNNLTGKATHECYCEKNPNRLTHNPGSQKVHNNKLQRNYKLYNGDVLDVTNEFVSNYLDTHTTCEICGKTISEASKSTRKNSPKRLCIDHNHTTKKFRGVLCSVCNRQLGWYEANKESIKRYLSEKDK